MRGSSRAGSCQNSEKHEPFQVRDVTNCDDHTYLQGTRVRGFEPWLLEEGFRPPKSYFIQEFL